MKIVWLKRALDDRDAQIDYIALNNVTAAIEQGDRLETHADLLADQPRLGREGRVAGTRELVVPHTPFIIIYRLGPNRIEILRVLHGAQLWPPEGGD